MKGFMDKHNQMQLRIDPEFSELIPPLSESEYEYLEDNIRKEGCLNPIIVWQNTIVDGHNRYRICKKWDIPFEIEERPFGGRDEAIVWICVNQLARRNISEETRKYLIGKQFDAEKMIRRRNARINGLFRLPGGRQSENIIDENDYDGHDTECKQRKNPTAERIGDDYHLSHSTVEKYATYSRALDIIGKKAPPMQSKILSGQYKISHENIVMLAKMNDTSVQNLEERLTAKQNSAAFVSFSISRDEISECVANEEKPVLHTEIKNMPVFDPDAEVNGLALTIPTWINFIVRIREKANFEDATPEALSRLRNVLKDLTASIESILQIMKEEQNGE